MDCPVDQTHISSFWEGYLLNEFQPPRSLTFHVSLIDKDKLCFDLKTFLHRALVPD